MVSVDRCSVKEFITPSLDPLTGCAFYGPCDDRGWGSHGRRARERGGRGKLWDRRAVKEEKESREVAKKGYGKRRKIQFGLPAKAVFSDLCPAGIPQVPEASEVGMRAKVALQWVTSNETQFLIRSLSSNLVNYSLVSNRTYTPTTDLSFKVTGSPSFSMEAGFSQVQEAANLSASRFGRVERPERRAESWSLVNFMVMRHDAVQWQTTSNQSEYRRPSRWPIPEKHMM